MEEQVLREREVLKIVGLSRSSLWRKERLGVFPPRRKLGVGGRAIGWLLSEVRQWLEGLKDQNQHEQEGQNRDRP